MFKTILVWSILAFCIASSTAHYGSVVQTSLHSSPSPLRAHSSMRAQDSSVRATHSSMRATQSSMRPIVLLHGLLATHEAMSHIVQWIEHDFNGTQVYVKNVALFNDSSKLDSLFTDINDQVQLFAQQIAMDEKVLFVLFCFVCYILWMV